MAQPIEGSTQPIAAIATAAGRGGIGVVRVSGVGLAPVIDALLGPAQARRLAEQTFAGAASLSASSQESPETLRARVTSKGGTTHAALTSLEAGGVGAAFERALLAARDRAEELGRPSPGSQ